MRGVPVEERGLPFLRHGLFLYASTLRPLVLGEDRPAGLRQEQGGAELKRTERVRGVEKGGLAPRPEHRASMTAAMTARLSPGKWPEMVSALRGRAALEPLRFRWKHILRFGDSWRIRRE